MPAASKLDAEKLIGRAPARLTLAECEALVGKYIAQEIYTPNTLPLQRIEAIGNSVQECVLTLRGRGLDPLSFEFVRLPPSY